MRKYRLLVLSFLFVALVGCQAPCDDIYILYDNDVHCSVEGYEKMAALRAEYLKQSIYVNVVSSGDFVQGNKVGSISKGKYPVAMMNAVPYDYVTLGNHEFDYGIPQLKRLMLLSRAKCLCCNFSELGTGKKMFPAYAVRTYGTTKVAFIGVATPTTSVTSSPSNFQDKNGDWLYTFHKDEVVQLVQQAANAARQDHADIVIVLSHLGDDTQDINSVQLIAQTTGIDAVLDGHQHHVLDTKIANAEGDSVILTSTGSNFRYAGCLKIDKNNNVHNLLIDLSSYNGTNKRVHSRWESIMKKVRSKTDKYVGFSQLTLTDSDENGNRLVRLGETNLGDFSADAIRAVTKADIGLIIGGGIRSSLQAGEVSYGDLLQVFPFNNTVYKVEVTGADLLRALEIAVSVYPVESGDFLHVSGLRYAFDSSVPTSVHLDENGVCDTIGATRRIVSAETEHDGIWQSVDSNAVYSIGGLDYFLVNGGSCGMFMHPKQIEVEHLSDADVMAEYIHLLGDTIPTDIYMLPQGRVTLVDHGF